MSRIRSSVIFGILVILFSLSVDSRMARIDASNLNVAATPAVNDWWKYNVDFKGTIGMLGIITIQITSGSQQIWIYGNTYDCYVVGTTGSGTIYGQGVTGTWTMSGQAFYQKTDQSLVKTTLTTDSTATSSLASATVRQVVESTYNPPLGAGEESSLATGESWAKATTETTTTTSTINGVTDTNTGTSSYTKNYMVLRSQSTTVSAGTFTTFVVRMTDTRGNYANYYYSTEAGGDVKEEEYDTTGQLAFTAELVQYHYTPDTGISGVSPWTTAAIVAGIIIVAGAAVLIYMHNSRKPQTTEGPPAPPSTLPPPPTSSTSRNQSSMQS